MDYYFTQQGIDIAPYSFFNGVASDPPMVMFANNGPAPDKNGANTFSNIKVNQEFVVNISLENKDLMNLTCSPFGRGESEIDLAALETIESN